MLSNLEQHFTVESLHHEIPLEEDDVSSSSSDSDTDSIQNGEQGDDLPELPWTDEEVRPYISLFFSLFLLLLL